MVFLCFSQRNLGQKVNEPELKIFWPKKQVKIVMQESESFITESGCVFQSIIEFLLNDLQILNKKLKFVSINVTNLLSLTEFLFIELYERLTKLSISILKAHSQQWMSSKELWYLGWVWFIIMLCIYKFVSTNTFNCHDTIA